MEIINNDISGDKINETPKLAKFAVDTPNTMKKSILPIFIGALIAVLLFAAVWYFFLRNLPISFSSKDGGFLNIDNNGNTAVLAENPLTGEKFTESEAASWINNRPLAVMVNNYIDARPQSGLIYADVVYEIVAEGGITRFLAFFLDTTPEKIGPVRSTREYYLVLVKELGDAMLMHIGWSPQALEAIETWPVRSLGRGGGTFWRDNPRDVAIEHTAYTNGVELREIASGLGWDGTRETVSWIFKDDQETYKDNPSATKISIDFWFEGDYSAIFEYDQDKNSYKRFMGYDEEGNPIPHSDQENNAQIEPKNVIVQFVSETSIDGDDKNRLEYELIGSGSALIFEDGKVIEATWTKSSRDGRTLFYDFNGNPVKFNRGQMWISVVPDRNVDQVVFN